MACIKRDKYDATFSDLIRERADWTCERCGLECRKEGQDSRRLDCSHFYSRANRSVRWHPLNAAAHCFRCHQELGGNPVLFREWILEYLGPELDQRLRELAHTPRKWKPWEKDEMREHYANQLKMLKARRAAGDRGYIEVVSYD